jgi:molybdenum cofactor cytidylyltransferase
VLSAVVLAAGNSERMGRPKALLEIDGETFLARICRRLREAGMSDVVVVLGRDAAEIQSGWNRGNERIVLNHRPQDGQISSLNLALESFLPGLWPDAVFVCLVDSPLVRAETYRRLAAEWRQRQGQMVVPRYQGKRGHPLVLDHRFWHECRLAPLDQGLHWVTHRHRPEMVDVDVDDPGVVRDADTPDDYERLIGKS